MFTDSTALQSREYGSRGPLAARLAIYDYQQDRVDLPGLALEGLSATTGRVLDAGCGLGTYVDRIRTERTDLHVVPLDLSAGMAAEVVADVQRLPLADGSVDAALAMHMLYHVPDIEAAAGELRRVVRPGGVLLVSTNGAADKVELDALWCAAVEDLTGRPTTAPAGDDRFTLDDGDLLRTAFDEVTVRVFDRETLVPDVEPVLAFVDSLRGLGEELLPPGVAWDDFLGAARARVADEVARTGHWRLTSQVGVFTCR